MTRVRTDIHRPSAPEFDPQAYELYGVFDFHPEEGNGAERIFVVNQLLKQGYRFGSGGMGSCGHCGAHIRYGALMAHEASHEMIYVGETCLDNRFGGTKADFDALRKAAAVRAEQARKMGRFDRDCAEHPWLAYASYVRDWGDYRRHGSKAIDIVEDLVDKARRHGLSEAQHGLGDKALGWIAESEERAVARDAAKAAQVAAGVAVPTGRVAIEGTVTTVRWQDSQYGGSLKIRVLADEGWAVWGTAPSALSTMFHNVEKGDRVAFTATVEASNDDPTFGFYKRPTKARLIEPVLEVTA